MDFSVDEIERVWYFSFFDSFDFFFFLQPASEMKANLQFHLRIFVVLFKCLDPDNVENHPHPVSM